MDASRAAREEIALQLDQPLREHLKEEVVHIGHGAHILAVGERLANETTPLVVMAGKQRVYVDLDVELEALDKKLHDDESETIRVDRQTPAMEVLQEEAASLVRLSIPITFTLVLEIVPLILLAMMIGNVSGEASPQVLAAANLSDFFQGQVTANFINGLGAAIAMVCAQSFGAEQYTQLWIYVQSGLLASVYCVVPIGLLCFQGSTILRLMGQDPELSRIAGTFITIGFCNVPFAIVYTIARSALQAQNIATPFVVASILSYTVSLPLAYVLGYHTSLGYIGIALSSVVSSFIKAVACIPILLKNDVFADAWPGWLFKQAHHRVLKLWPVGAASVLMATFQTAGFNAVALICGYLPNAAMVMTASGISSALLILAFIPMMGICAGGTVRVGDALGAGQPRRASLASLVVILAMLCVAAAGIVLCWYFAGSYAKAYTSDGSTIATSERLVKHLLWLIPLVGLVYAAQSIFQACGAQWLCAKLNFLFLFAVGVPLGLWLAFSLERGVFGLWDGQLLGAVGLTATAGAWLHRLDWHRVAHEARLNAHLHVEREPSPEPQASDNRSK